MTETQNQLQDAIFDGPLGHHLVFECDLRGGASDAAQGAMLKALSQLVGGELPVCIALGPTLTQRLENGPTFTPFTLNAPVPTTQRELFVWVQGADRGALFDMARRVRAIIDPVCELALEINGFTYHDTRDLTGFVDGIGNPKAEKALLAAQIPQGEPGAGGSWVLTQQWVHQLEAFHALSETQQECVIGRTKADAVELSSEHMPVNAHVARTDIKHDGVPQKIWRRSFPYGDSQTHGLYFLAFSCDKHRHTYLLESMYGKVDAGVEDALLKYSSPVTGAWWFAPSKAQWAAL